MSENKREQWQIFSTLYLFCAAYAALHKILVPISLKFFTVNVSSYAVIDYKVLPSIYFAYLLYKQDRLTKLSSFLAGVTVVFGVVEVCAALMGEFRGWLFVSHMISTVPLSLISIGLLTISEKEAGEGRSYKHAWAGALLILLVFIVDMGFLRGLKKSAHEINPKQSTLIQPEVELRALSCGESGFVFNKSLKINKSEELDIAFVDCGITPPAYEFDSEHVPRLENKLKTSINVHLVYFDQQGRRRNWNRVVQSMEIITIAENIDWSKLRYAVLFSDNSPKSGLSFLYPKDFDSFVKVQRIAPYVIEIQR